MDDLLKIIKWKDELFQIEYTISKLEIAEENFVQEENYEKAQLMLIEQKRLIKRKRYLETKIKNK
jgi:hypothetical protein